MSKRQLGNWLVKTYSAIFIHFQEYCTEFTKISTIIDKIKIKQQKDSEFNSKLADYSKSI